MKKGYGDPLGQYLLQSRYKEKLRTKYTQSISLVRRLDSTILSPRYSHIYLHVIGVEKKSVTLALIYDMHCRKSSLKYKGTKILLANFVSVLCRIF